MRRTGDAVLSRVLAGTVGRLGDDAADGELADALLGSEKDLEEHELAVHSVAAVLARPLRPSWTSPSSRPCCGCATCSTSPPT